MTFPTTEATGSLKRSGSITLDANGNGVIDFAPQNSRQRWVVTGVVVLTNQAPTAIPVPIATVTKNGVHYGKTTVISAGASAGATWSGSQDTFQGNMDIGPCDQLSVVFSAGVPGSIAFANVAGTYFTRTA